ncbi:MAG: hypothetical protein M5R40_02470 [Anaerolineae bacterium]|nr:hypothetical protein [Anaerolineae bacterium]
MEDIIAHKRSAIARRKQAVPLNAVRAQARMQVRPLDIISCLRDGRLSVIPHLQQASPELGLYVRQYDPVGLARLFEQNGAAAISVTTEERFYYGRHGPPDAGQARGERAGVGPRLRHRPLSDLRGAALRAPTASSCSPTCSTTTRCGR